MIIGSLPYYILFIALALVLLVVYCAVFLLTVLIDRRRMVLHGVGRAWSWCIYAICPLWRVRVTGKENARRGEGSVKGLGEGEGRKKGFVIVANHQSLLDIPLLYRIPLHFKWVSKREVLRMPVFGAVLWMQNNITIRRGEAADAKRFLEEGRRWLDRGVSVMVFPEGTRSPSGKMRRFREGAFLLAKKAGAPILPVATEGTGSLNKGWRLRMPHAFRVSILPPVSAREIAETGVKEMAAKVQKMIENERDTFPCHKS